MPASTRRKFIALSAASVFSPMLRSLAEHGSGYTVTLQVNKSGPTIPANFVGLSYRTQQLAELNFFSPANSGLIARFRELSPRGILRLGGTVSDKGLWQSSPQSPLPSGHFLFTITPQAIRNLRGFLDQTGWTCIYGINLASNTPARAADEAEFVSKTLESKLQYFQIGNEPDHFPKLHFRDASAWSPDAYFNEWLELANAIRARVPATVFGLPDTAGNPPKWMDTVVTHLMAMNNPPAIAALSHHHYCVRAASNPKPAIEDLLQPDREVETLATTCQSASARLSAACKHKVPYYLTEGNSCAGGGLPGISDVFASALWAADFLLNLASLGYAGVNIHGGDGEQTDELTVDSPALDSSNGHPHPYYTPINHTDSAYVAEPVYYGLRFANAFAGARLIPVDFNPGSVNATAYAAIQPNGQSIIAIINKDDKKPLQINLPDYSVMLTMSAPALTSATVSLVESSTHTPATAVPPATAILLRKIAS